MKLKSKHKWALVGLLFILGWVGLLIFPQLGFAYGFIPTMLSFVLMMCAAGFGIHGIEQHKLLPRLYDWIKSDE